MRILIAWELGENFGHLLSQLVLFQQLRARGHDVLVAVKDIEIGRQVLQGQGIPYLQAPIPRPTLRSTLRLEREIANFGDILAFHGFAELPVLDALVHGWQQLFRLYRPDALVVNHAPAALFAARLSRIPTAQAGTGFELPPPSSPYPCFRPWLKLPESALVRTEAAILANLNHLCKSQAQPPLQKLADLMQTGAQLLLTFPEIDHYSERANAQYLGPLFAASDGLAVDWPASSRKNIFVYVRPGDTLAPMLDALRQVDADVICAIPGIDADTRARYETPSLRIHDTALKLQPLLARCDLAVSHAGHGMTAACMLAGVSMLMVPLHVEQLLASLRVRKAGMGLALLADEVPLHFASALQRLLDDPGYAIRARQLAAKYKNYDQRKTVMLIVTAIEQLGDLTSSRDPASRAF